MWNRRLRHPLTMPEEVGEAIWLRNHANSEPRKAAFISQQGQNTALVFVEDQGLRLARRNQWTNRSEAEVTYKSPTLVEPAKSNAELLQRTDGGLSGPTGEEHVAAPPQESFEMDSGWQSVAGKRRYHLRDLPRLCYKE